MHTFIRCPVRTLLTIFLIILSFNISATHVIKFPRTRKFGKHTQNQPKKPLQDDEIEFKVYYYTQTLDHFNYKPESFTTFQQRYAINTKYWGGSNSPILVYFGAEEYLEDDVFGIGFLPDNASLFKALLLYIEHRYYGRSLPFGSRKEALRNASTLGYCNSAQALADYAAIINHVIQKYSAKVAPVIVIGGSYGGLLAAWFRLKYPHIAVGALASSAPILYFDEFVPQLGFYSLITNDFKEASESCYETIKESWTEIDKLASHPHGLSMLSTKFRTCKPLKSTKELKDFLENIYVEAAQFDTPSVDRVRYVCEAIDGAPKGTDILDRVMAAVTVYMPPSPSNCYDTNNFDGLDIDSSRPWKWQSCTELVIRMEHEKNTMFPFYSFDMNEYMEQCKAIFGILPQPSWIPSYYGTNDIMLNLRRYGSNIIFSNGLRDPYSSGGVLKNISDSIVAVTAVDGSHCLDIAKADASDPKWLVMQRKTEVEIILGWISKYYHDLYLNSTR